jgi:L-ascorbate metabolism protein UlaG (beta-lactamase superfamily)
MIINWFGQTSFRIQGDKSVLITDPFDASFGLKVPRYSADVVTLSDSNNEHLNAEAVKGTSADSEPHIISVPGEYEVKSIFIIGVKPHGEKTNNLIYRFEIDGVTIGHLGNLDHVLSNGELERMEGVDILMIPVGGGKALNAKQATEIISQLEPRIVIPMAYNIPGLKTKEKLDDLNAFCKEIGVCPKEKMAKFKVTKKDLPAEDLQVIVFEV